MGHAALRRYPAVYGTVNPAGASFFLRCAKVLSGNPNPGYISTSYVERQNLTMRMSMRRFTRLTNGFSKKLANHEHMLSIYFMYYNFCRMHQTLRVTPAMEARSTDHVWGVEELVKLMEPKSILDGLIRAA